MGIKNRCQVEYLDTTWNLSGTTYRLSFDFWKWQWSDIYTHKEWVHIHHKVVLSTLSPDEKIFNSPAHVNQEALEKTRYNHQSKLKKIRTQASTLRQSKILLIQSTKINKNVKTKADSYFFNLLVSIFHQIVNSVNYSLEKI